MVCETVVVELMSTFAMNCHVDFCYENTIDAMNCSLEKAPKGTEFAGKRYREYHSPTGHVTRSRFTNSNIVIDIEVITVM